MPARTPCARRRHPRRRSKRRRAARRSRRPSSWSCSGRTCRRAAGCPTPIAAAASADIAPSGSSAITVTCSLAALSLPAVTPPNLRKSFSLISAALPTPTTIRRSALIPSGAGMSSVDPLLPLNWLAAAARLTVSAALPSAFRVASPNFNSSSQNATRTPRGAVEKATKPTLTASDMGKSSRIEAADGSGIRPV